MGLVLGILLLVTVVAEVRLLQQIELSNVYIAIIAVETLIVLGYAIWAGESLGSRELAGGVLVIAGTLLVGA